MTHIDRLVIDLDMHIQMICVPIPMNAKIPLPTHQTNKSAKIRVSEFVIFLTNKLRLS